MRCRRIQELLKSDYLDGELSLSQAELVKEHLKGCLECRRLEEELTKQHLLFQQATRFKAPERVWENIREEILAEQPAGEYGLSRGILERLRTTFSRPQVAFSLASALTGVIIALFFAGSALKKQRGASIDEIVSSYGLNGTLYDLGTNIEEQFL